MATTASAWRRGQVEPWLDAYAPLDTVAVRGRLGDNCGCGADRRDGSDARKEAIMRISMLVAPAAAALAAAAAASAAAPPLTTSYLWAQPDAAPVVAPLAVLPAWLPWRPIELTPLTTYPWAQPGSAPAEVPFAQPWSL